ncbi:MAG: TlpA family protein disulfide reductase [Candidatus Krumholzibacteriia bacterium]
MNILLPAHLRAGALLVILLVTAAGCGDGGRGADAGTGTVAAKGGPAPDFTLPRVDGGTLRLADLQGQAVILDFWDTWCPPCRRAMPHLQELHDQYAGQLTVVGVAFGRDGKGSVTKFLAERNLTFPNVLMDEQYETARAYGGLQSIPTTFLIDAEGVIREVWVGGFEKADYEAALRPVLGL